MHRNWNVKTELDFFKKLPNGELQNFTGEQRRETEKFIKTSIGEQEDFLMTILTTASNLEDLLEAKPTARGQVLSKFLGLDFLKTKEETGKEIFSEFSKQMVSNVYSHITLKKENDEMEERINTIKSDNNKIFIMNGLESVVFKDKKFSDILEEIYSNQKQKQKQLRLIGTNIKIK